MLGSKRSGGAGHRIGADAVFEGTLRFSGRLEIEGVVTGKIVAEAPEAATITSLPSGASATILPVTTPSISSRPLKRSVPSNIASAPIL